MYNNYVIMNVLYIIVFVYYYSYRKHLKRLIHFTNNPNLVASGKKKLKKSKYLYLCIIMYNIIIGSYHKINHFRIDQMLIYSLIFSHIVHEPIYL